VTRHQKMSDVNNVVEQTIYVRDGGHATIVCPTCGKAKTDPVSQFVRRNKRKLRVQCSCQARFIINLDYRRSFRKPTNIIGQYSINDASYGEGLAKVRDLSLLGISFETSQSHAMSIGQKGVIDFTLDNKKRSKLRKEFSVKSVNGNILGCEFMRDQAYEKDLGFYLIHGN